MLFLLFFLISQGVLVKMIVDEAVKALTRMDEIDDNNDQDQEAILFNKDC